MAQEIHKMFETRTKEQKCKTIPYTACLFPEKCFPITCPFWPPHPLGRADEVIRSVFDPIRIRERGGKGQAI